MSLLFGFFGLFIGSFLNVVIDRIPQGRTIWKGRSVCDHCHKKLQPIDLIPVLSFLFLGGRCRYCGASIPFRIFFVEILTGTLFYFISSWYLQHSLSIISMAYLILVTCIFICIFFIDIEYGIIPDSLNIVLGISALMYLVFFDKIHIPSSILSAMVVCLMFLLLFLITRGKGMGFGDVKYAFVMGLILGFPRIIVGLYVAFLTGALISLVLIAFGKKKLKGTVPFGPFLVFATFTAYIWGEQLVRYAIMKFF